MWQNPNLTRVNCFFKKKNKKKIKKSKKKSKKNHKLTHGTQLTPSMMP